MYLQAKLDSLDIFLRQLIYEVTVLSHRDPKNLHQRNWVFATNSDFLITISLEPNVADLRYFKLWILLDQIIWVWNIKGLQHWVLKILRFKYLILFQRLNSFQGCIDFKKSQRLGLAFVFFWSSELYTL